MDKVHRHRGIERFIKAQFTKTPFNAKITVVISSHISFIECFQNSQVVEKNRPEIMVRAWYMDNETTDQRLEHHRNPPKFIELDELHKKTGVEYFQASSNFIMYFDSFACIRSKIKLYRADR